MAIAVHAAEFAFDARSQGGPVWSLVLNTPLASRLTLVVVVVAPVGKPAPLPSSVTRHASDSFQAPAHRERSLRQGLRLISINTAGDFPIRTPESTGRVHGYARTQEQHDRQCDYQGCPFHHSSSFAGFTGRASFRYKRGRSFRRPTKCNCRVDKSR